MILVKDMEYMIFTSIVKYPVVIPLFQLRIKKDTITIWQLYDSYKAEFVPD